MASLLEWLDSTSVVPRYAELLSLIRRFEPDSEVIAGYALFSDRVATVNTSRLGVVLTPTHVVSVHVTLTIDPGRPENVRTADIVVKRLPVSEIIHIERSYRLTNDGFSFEMAPPTLTIHFRTSSGLEPFMLPVPAETNPLNSYAAFCTALLERHG